MTEEIKKRRNRRSKDEIAYDLTQKYEAEIAKYREKIAVLEGKIEELKHPKTTVKMKDVTEKIKELDLPLDEVLALLEKKADKASKKQ